MGETIGPSVMETISCIGKSFFALKIPIIAETAAVVIFKLIMLSIVAIQGVMEGVKSAYEIVVFVVKISTNMWAAA